MENQPEAQPVTSLSETAQAAPPSTPHKSRKKVALFLILILVLPFALYSLATIITSSFFGLSTGTLVLPTISIDPPTTSPWKTYVDTKHNYSIQYPAELRLDGDHTSDFISIGKQITIEVSPNNPRNCRDCGVGGGHTRNVVINNNPAVEFEGYIGRNGSKIPQEFLQVVFPHNGLFYIFTVNELPYDHRETVTRELKDLKDVDPKAVAQFNQILSTVTFTKDSLTTNWKTYESAAAGLSFQYPDDFVVEETPNVRISINYKKDNKTFLVLQYAKREPTSYIQESEKYYADGLAKGCKVDEISTITADQTEMKVYENFTCEGQTNTPLIIYSKNNITYDASVFGKTDQDALARILATFKFTN